MHSDLTRCCFCDTGFTLLDSDGGEIMCTGFNETADKWDPVIQVGAIITMSKASLKPKRKTVSFLRMHILTQCALTVQLQFRGELERIMHLPWHCTLHVPLGIAVRYQTACR